MALLCLASVVRAADSIPQDMNSSAVAPIVPTAPVVAPAPAVIAPSSQVPAASTSQAPVVPSPIVPKTLTAAEVFSASKDLVFKVATRLNGVNSESLHGTGFVVGKNGYVMTNYHVVADFMAAPNKYSLTVDVAGQSQVAQVVAIDTVNDLAVISIPSRFPRALPLAKAVNLAVGETMYSLGFPVSEPLGIVQGNFNGERAMGFSPVLAASIPLNHGMSGGPSFNAFGEVIGVNRALRGEAQNISYFSPLPAVQKLVLLLNENGRGLASLTSPPTEWRLSAVQQIKEREKEVLGPTSENRSERQLIGKISFVPPVKGMQCGQDAADKLERFAVGEFLICQTTGLSLVTPKIESLAVKLFAFSSASSAGSLLAFANVDQRYRGQRELNIRSDSQNRSDDSPGSNPERAFPSSLGGSGRMVASLIANEPMRGQHCQAKNVLNHNGVSMVVRYCSLAVPSFKGLYSTYLKVDVLTKGKSHTSFGETFEGLSLSATSVMIERFLESIEVSI